VTFVQINISIYPFLATAFPPFPNIMCFPRTPADDEAAMAAETKSPVFQSPFSIPIPVFHFFWLCLLRNAGGRGRKEMVEGMNSSAQNKQGQF
jgi:hypothetical protein